MRVARLIVLTALAGLASTAHSSGDAPTLPKWHAGSTWAVAVFSLNQDLIGSMVVQFASERANSCITGDWRQLKVVRRRFKDTDFLATRPLSYSVEGNTLTLGVTEVCDGYVFLKGVITDEGVTGDYGTLNLGGFHKLGSFVATMVNDGP